MSHSLNSLADEQLVESLKQLVTRERECTHQIVLHLAELDRRRLYAELGFSSLFDYAVRALRYSRMSAQRRIVAARVVLQVPEAYELIAEGKLSLAVCEVLSPVLGQSNSLELLQEAAGKGVEEVRVIVARNFPVSGQAVKDRIAPVFTKDSELSDGQGELFESSTPSRSGVAPEVQYRISFTASAKLKQKLDRVQGLVYGLSPEGNMANVLEEIVDFYLKRCSPQARLKRRQERLAKRERAQRERIPPRPVELMELAEVIKKSRKAAEEESRRVSLSTRDRILERDGYRCSYVAADGTRCECEVNLEVDHITPWALGGRTVDENLRVLCRLCRYRHNGHYAAFVIMPRRARETLVTH